MTNSRTSLSRIAHAAIVVLIGASAQAQTIPIEPPRAPLDQGRLAIVGSFSLPFGAYTYETTVEMAGRNVYRGVGSQRSVGLRFDLGGEVSLPGPLRRLTVGGLVGEQGYLTDNAQVVPVAQASLPFSVANLKTAVDAALDDKRQRLLTEWSLGISFYVEHDVWIVRAPRSTLRLRAGYQHRRQQTSGVDGSFAASRTADGRFTTTFTSPAIHMLRLSLDALDNGARKGPLMQYSVLLGQQRTIVVSMAVGGFLRVGRPRP
jgi:hypothetical protein